MQKEAAPGGRRRRGKSHQNQEKTCRITSRRSEILNGPAEEMRRKKSTYRHPTTSFLQKYSNENEDPTTSKKERKQQLLTTVPHMQKNCAVPPKKKNPCLPCTQFYQDPVFREIQKKAQRVLYLRNIASVRAPLLVFQRRLSLVFLLVSVHHGLNCSAKKEKETR